MRDHSKQIVCISVHYWDDAWFRKQQFMSRFADNGYRVAYIEPSFSLARKPDEHKKKFQTNKALKILVEQRSRNLYIIKPPQSLPFISQPFINKLNYKYYSLRMNRVLRNLGFSNYIIWTYRLEYAFGIKYFNYNKLVFDCSDDYIAFRKEEKKKQYIAECANYLTKNADLMIVTAYTLLNKYKSLSRNICLVPNGFDSRLFSANNKSIPSDISNIKKPIIGFVGTLFSFLDYELLEYVIKNNRDKSFVFIGALEDHSKTKWENIIKKYANVFWLGIKKKEVIPDYIKNFDACLNPFKVDDVSRSVSPLKVFEYLAARKPVVSVRMESLEREEIAPFIYFSSSYNEFNNKIDLALREKEQFQSRLNYDTVLQYSWDKLFDNIYNQIKKL